MGSEANGKSRSETPHGYRNDGDLDRIGDSDGDNRADVDGDAPWDYKPEIDESANYHDGDDAAALAYGSPAGAAEERAIAQVVTRYDQAAAAGDGRAACALLTPSLARAAALDYGQASGPSYLRGAKSCQAIMSLLFKHSGASIASLVVTGVRVLGGHALALLGSRTGDAGYINLQRENGAWTIGVLTGSTLP